jgi:hypothetical protein
MNDELNELEVLTAAWKEQEPAVPADLARMVKRQGIWIRFHTAAALVTAALFLGASLWAAIHFESVEFLVLAIGVWMLTLGTSIFQLKNQASTWTAESNTTKEFIGLSLRRCRSGLRGVRFGLWLLLVEVLFLALWHAWYWSSRPASPPLSTWLLAAALPLAFLAGLLYLRSYRLRQLARLERIQRELSD